MTDTSVPSLQRTARFLRPWRGRQRGVGAVDGILYTAIFAGALVTTSQYIESRSDAQDRTIAASNLRLVLEGSQSYAAAEYDRIREDLRAAAAASGTAIAEIPMTALTDSGHLPDEMLTPAGALQNLWRQDHALLARAVNRSDPAVPKTTMTAAQIDADADGAIDPNLVDGDPANGEMDLEIILVSTGGEDVPPTTANPIIVQSALASAGYVQNPDIAQGPYANWSLDISPFASLASYPQPGRFASAVALSDYGVMNTAAARSGDSGEYFSRCAGLLDAGYTQASAAYVDCLNNADNEVLNSIVFNADRDGDGTPDFAPAIENVARIDCNDTGSAAAPGQLILDCNETRLTGSIVVDRDGDIAGNLTVGNRMTSAALTTGSATVTGNASVSGSISSNSLSTGNASVSNNLSAGGTVSSASMSTGHVNTSSYYASGNGNVRDVYLRSINRWASSLANSSSLNGNVETVCARLPRCRAGWSPAGSWIAVGPRRGGGGESGPPDRGTLNCVLCVR